LKSVDAVVGMDRVMLSIAPTSSFSVSVQMLVDNEPTSSPAPSVVELPVLTADAAAPSSPVLTRSPVLDEGTVGQVSNAVATAQWLMQSATAVMENAGRVIGEKRKRSADVLSSLLVESEPEKPVVMSIDVSGTGVCRVSLLANDDSTQRRVASRIHKAVHSSAASLLAAAEPARKASESFIGKAGELVTDVVTEVKRASATKGRPLGELTMASAQRLADRALADPRAQQLKVAASKLVEKGTRAATWAAQAFDTDPDRMRDVAV